MTQHKYASSAGHAILPQDRKTFIEEEARSVRQLIWTDMPRDQRPPVNDVKTIVQQVLDPEIAANHLGVTVTYFDLGCSEDEEGTYAVAGIVYRSENRIAISDHHYFSTPEKRFTLAHEIGHLQLHPYEGLHRDRLIKGHGSPYRSYDPNELEANYFAACLTMPAPLVYIAFEERFGKLPIAFNASIAFELCPNDADSLQSPSKGSMQRHLHIAKAAHFNGKHFEPLTSLFKVSPQAMAYRLKELGLVKNYP